MTSIWNGVASAAFGRSVGAPMGGGGHHGGGGMHGGHGGYHPGVFRPGHYFHGGRYFVRPVSWFDTGFYIDGRNCLIRSTDRQALRAAVAAVTALHGVEPIGWGRAGDWAMYPTGMCDALYAMFGPWGGASVPGAVGSPQPLSLPAPAAACEEGYHYDTNYQRCVPDSRSASPYGPPGYQWEWNKAHRKWVLVPQGSYGRGLAGAVGAILPSISNYYKWFRTALIDAQEASKNLQAAGSPDPYAAMNVSSQYLNGAAQAAAQWWLLAGNTGVPASRLGEARPYLETAASWISNKWTETPHAAENFDWSTVFPKPWGRQLAYNSTEWATIMQVRDHTGTIPAAPQQPAGTLFPQGPGSGFGQGIQQAHQQQQAGAGAFGQGIQQAAHQAPQQQHQQGQPNLQVKPTADAGAGVQAPIGPFGPLVPGSGREQSQHQNNGGPAQGGSDGPFGPLVDDTNDAIKRLQDLARQQQAAAQGGSANNGGADVTSGDNKILADAKAQQDAKQASSTSSTIGALVVGAVVGGVAGAVAGTKIPSKEGTAIGATAGAVIGAVVVALAEGSRS